MFDCIDFGKSLFFLFSCSALKFLLSMIFSFFLYVFKGSTKSCKSELAKFYFGFVFKPTFFWFMQKALSCFGLIFSLKFLCFLLLVGFPPYDLELGFAMNLRVFFDLLFYFMGYLSFSGFFIVFLFHGWIGISSVLRDYIPEKVYFSFCSVSLNLISIITLLSVLNMPVRHEIFFYSIGGFYLFVLIKYVLLFSFFSFLLYSLADFTKLALKE